MSKPLIVVLRNSQILNAYSTASCIVYNHQNTNHNSDCSWHRSLSPVFTKCAIWTVEMSKSKSEIYSSEVVFIISAFCSGGLPSPIPPSATTVPVEPRNNQCIYGNRTAETVVCHTLVTCSTVFFRFSPVISNIKHPQTKWREILSSYIAIYQPSRHSWRSVILRVTSLCHLLASCNMFASWWAQINYSTVLIDLLLNTFIPS